jgi:DNA-directed RNA polymerase specialized sigma24 family protein
MDSSSVSKPEWTLTEAAFAGFLACLSADTELAGQQYEKLHLKLVKFFDWQGAHFPEECADETLNRVIRKVEAGETIRDIVSYCQGVARLVFLETLKHSEYKKASLDELTAVAVLEVESEDADNRTQCFADCLRQLPASSQQLILTYYKEEKREKIDNRQAMADQLGIPLNALRSRAQRVRNKLETCVNRCMKKKELR